MKEKNTVKTTELSQTANTDNLLIMSVESDQYLKDIEAIQVEQSRTNADIEAIKQAENDLIREIYG